jgi:hypothetical protein
VTELQLAVCLSAALGVLAGVSTAVAVQWRSRKYVRRIMGLRNELRAKEQALQAARDTNTGWETHVRDLKEETAWIVTECRKYIEALPPIFGDRQRANILRMLNQRETSDGPK